ncbi:MAG: signal peptidase I [Clostridia bacterium]|nr:signal peptidase I [Clostridia bacterium]
MNTFNNDFIQYDKKKGKKETKNLAVYLTTTITLYIFLLFFAIFFTWYTVFISTHKYYKVVGPSMKSTLNATIADTDIDKSIDAVYVNTMSKVRVFDMIVAERGEDDVIKRVLAQEGDFITIAKDVTKQTNNYYFYRIAAGQNPQEISDADAMLDESTGENGYKIRGYADWNNNRSPYSHAIEVGGATLTNSYETIFYNTFLKQFEGKDLATYDNVYVSENGLIYVQVPEGKYFCMGDNRGHSDDSRKNGFYDVEYIVGRVEFIVYDHNFGNRLWEVVKYYFGQVEEFFAR